MDASEIKAALWRTGVTQRQLARALNMNAPLLSALLRLGYPLSAELGEKMLSTIDTLAGTTADTRS